jgi:type II secretory pathway pseudopilin PulG
MNRHIRNQGFSTVELLISLFIAAAFITTGFQLFSVVTKDSNKAQLRARAASIVNTTIQERASNAAPTCTPKSDSPTNIPTAQLPQPATVTVTYTCPYGQSSKTTRVTAVVKYGTPQVTVEGSLDVTR